MLHPSYSEIMEKINSDSNETPVVNSRYSIVMATSKRARQIVSGDAEIDYDASNKPLSIAVKELYDGEISILPMTEEEALAEDAADKFNTEAKLSLDLEDEVETEE